MPIHPQGAQVSSIATGAACGTMIRRNHGQQQLDVAAGRCDCSVLRRRRDPSARPQTRGSPAAAVSRRAPRPCFLIPHLYCKCRKGIERLEGQILTAQQQTSCQDECPPPAVDVVLFESLLRKKLVWCLLFVRVAACALCLAFHRSTDQATHTSAPALASQESFEP